MSQAVQSPTTNVIELRPTPPAPEVTGSELQAMLVSVLVATMGKKQRRRAEAKLAESVLSAETAQARAVASQVLALIA